MLVSMKVAAIIQARMGSTRLPGKILKKVLNKTLLEYQIERVKRSKTLNEIIIATTTKESDSPIVELCEKLSIPVYRGSEENVLSRYYEAASEFNVDVIVRLTSDCPIIDPEVIDKVVNSYLNQLNEYDYVSNTLIRTYPRGLDTEVFSYEALKEAFMNADNKVFKEHVTAYIYSNREKFRLLNIENNLDLSQYRWTVDTEEDFELIRNIIRSMYRENPHFSMGDILLKYEKNPDWHHINSHIEQKKVEVIK